MSATTAAQPERRRSGGKIWLAILLLIAAGAGLAWLGAGSLRGETTASGLQFRTVEEGSGALIKPVDGVLIDYEGRLEDGTVFDTSAGRGPTPMLAGQVIPGFAEALTKMQKGGRYRIRIPPALGYGDSPQPGSPIPPNATLEFDVHVVQVVPNAAMMQGAQSGPPGQGQQPPPEQGQQTPPEQGQQTSPGQGQQTSPGQGQQTPTQP